MGKRVYSVLLIMITILYVVMMSYAWILKDLTSLTNAESILLYGTGFVVIAGWFFKPVNRKKRK